MSEDEQTLCYAGVIGAVEPYVHRPILTDLIYDLASLTKVIGTTTRIFQLIDSGKLSLDTKVCQILPPFSYREVTVGNLLLHNSGLMAEVVNKDKLTVENAGELLYQTPQIQPIKHLSFS